MEFTITVVCTCTCAYSFISGDSYSNSPLDKSLIESKYPHLSFVFCILLVKFGTFLWKRKPVDLF